MEKKLFETHILSLDEVSTETKLKSFDSLLQVKK